MITIHEYTQNTFNIYERKNKLMQHTTTSYIEIPPKGGGVGTATKGDGKSKLMHVLHMRITNFVPLL